MGKISKATIEQIDSQLLEVISHYVDLKKTGSLYKGLSPFNSEKSPSFIVTPSKSIWKDFSSGKGGKNPIKFVMEYEGLSFKDAVIKCADILGIEVEYDDGEEEELFYENAIQSLKDFFVSNLKGKALEYIRNRGLTDESIKAWEIGFAPSYKEMISFFNTSSYQKEFIRMKYFYKKDDGTIHPKFYNRIMFPINNSYGNTVGFSGRDITGKAKAKYVNSNDFEFFKKSKILFGLDKVAKDSKKIILVEGQLDVILSHQYGIRIAVASQGTAFTQFHFNLLKDKDALICFDGDAAGQRAIAKAVEIFLKNGIIPKVAVLPKDKDIADILSEKGRNELLRIIKQNESGIDFLIDNLLNSVAEEKRMEAVENIKSKVDLFPIHISEKILNILFAKTKRMELSLNANKAKYHDELILIKFILENGLEKQFIEPFKDCFNVKNFSYNFVKDVTSIDDNSFYDLWDEFESSCYKKRINKIKKSNLPYREKKEKIKELKECLNVTKAF